MTRRPLARTPHARPRPARGLHRRGPSPPPGVRTNVANRRLRPRSGSDPSRPVVSTAQISRREHDIPCRAPVLPRQPILSPRLRRLSRMHRKGLRRGQPRELLRSPTCPPRSRTSRSSRLPPLRRCRHRRAQHSGTQRPPAPASRVRGRRLLRRRTPSRPQLDRRTCRRRGGSSPPAAKSQRGRSCRRPDGPRHARRRRSRHQSLCCRLDCRCRRSRPTAARSRRRLGPVPASRFPRHRARLAPRRAAAALVGRAPRVDSGVPLGAVTVPIAALPAADELTPECLRCRADVRPARLAHDRQVRVADVHRGRAVSARVVVAGVSARSCSPSRSLPTRRSMRPCLKARSRSSGDRHLKRWPLD